MEETIEKREKEVEKVNLNRKDGEVMDKKRKGKERRNERENVKEDDDDYKDLLERDDDFFSSISTSDTPYWFSIHLPLINSTFLKQNNSNIKQFIKFQKSYNTLQLFFFNFYLSLVASVIRLSLKEGNLLNFEEL